MIGIGNPEAPKLEPKSVKKIERRIRGAGTAVKTALQGTGALARHTKYFKENVNKVVNKSVEDLCNKAFSKLDDEKHTHPYSASLQLGLLTGYVLGRSMTDLYDLDEYNEEILTTIHHLETQPYDLGDVLRQHGRAAFAKFGTLLPPELTQGIYDEDEDFAEERNQLYIGGLGYITAVGTVRLEVGEMYRIRARGRAVKTDVLEIGHAAETIEQMYEQGLPLSLADFGLPEPGTNSQ